MTNYDAASRQAMAAACNQRIDAKLVDAVSRRLGVTVTLARWDVERKTGASIPVFAVPPSHVVTAQSLGLRIDEDRR